MNCLLFYFIAIIIIRLYDSVLQRQCPKCKTIFAREKIDTKTLSKSGWFSLGHRLITYRCKYCGYVWEETADDDDSPDYLH